MAGLAAVDEFVLVCFGAAGSPPNDTVVVCPADELVFFFGLAGSPPNETDSPPSDTANPPAFSA